LDHKNRPLTGYEHLISFPFGQRFGHQSPRRIPPGRRPGGTGGGAAGRPELHRAGPGPTASGRSVAWVQGDTDTTRMFLDAMSQSFGGAVSQAIARELGLEPAPGKPLASRLIEQALDMAQTSQRALGGVDFLTLMDHSAQVGSASFRASCAELGIPPQQVGPEQRHQIDQWVRQQADAAVSQGQSPLSPPQVQGWLQEAIRHVCLPQA